jgi:hypothetical protein
VAPEPPIRAASPFPLWSDGAIPRIYRLLGLSDDALALLGRRELALTAIAWLPLFVMSALDGRAWTGAQVPFLLDFDVQARLLVALPLLIAGEVAVHRRMPQAVNDFVDRRIVAGPARSGFDAAVNSALALSRSPIVEIAIVIGAFTIGVVARRSIESLGGVTTWYAQPAGGTTAFTAAGWWFLLVSRPLFRVVTFRWYLKLFVWGRFLYQVSRLKLHLVPTHPDRMGGLGFLSVVSNSFVPFLFAHGTMLSGRIANGVLYGGRRLGEYQSEMITAPVLALLLVIGPQLAFASSLFRAKRAGLLEYGALAERYARQFEAKWLGRSSVSNAESLLGSADIQSLADLGGGFDIVEGTRVLPVTRQTILSLAIVTLLPLAPLALTVISGRELVERLVKVIF